MAVDLDELATRLMGGVEETPPEDDSVDVVGDEPRAEVEDEEDGEDEYEDEDEGELQEQGGDEEDEEDAEVDEAASLLTVVDPKTGEPKNVKLDDLLKDTLHDVKVEGKKLHVAYEELVNGYQRGRDYAAKMEAMSSEVRDMAPYAQMVAHAKQDPDFVEYVQNYFKYGPNQSAYFAAEPQLSNAEINALLNSDIESEVDRGRRAIAARAEMEKTSQTRTQAQEQARAEQQRFIERIKEEQFRIASGRIPDFESSWKRGQAALESLGFSKEEVENVFDARIMEGAVLIAEALELKGKKSNASTDLVRKRGQRKTRRKLMKTVAAGSGKPTSNSKNRAKQSFDRARDTGNINDWTDHLMKRFNLN